MCIYGGAHQVISGNVKYQQDKINRADKRRWIKTGHLEPYSAKE